MFHHKKTRPCLVPKNLKNDFDVTGNLKNFVKKFRKNTRATLQRGEAVLLLEGRNHGAFEETWWLKNRKKMVGIISGTGTWMIWCLARTTQETIKTGAVYVSICSILAPALKPWRGRAPDQRAFEDRDRPLAVFHQWPRESISLHKATRIRPNRAPESRRTGDKIKLFVSLHCNPRIIFLGGANLMDPRKGQEHAVWLTTV